MQRQRPTAVTVCAILNIVFSLMGLIGLVLGAIFVLVLVAVFENSSNPAFKELAGMVNIIWEAPGAMVFMIGANVVNMVLNGLLLAAGIGLWKMKPWGRWLSLIYAVGVIITTLAGTAYTILVLNPAIIEWQQSITKGKNPLAGSTMINDFSAIVGAIFGLIYPVVLLIILFLPSVVAAFKPKPAVMDVELVEDEAPKS